MDTEYTLEASAFVTVHVTAKSLIEAIAKADHVFNATEFVPGNLGVSAIDISLDDGGFDQID